MKPSVPFIQFFCLSLLILFLSFSEVQACIDPPDTITNITIEFDYSVYDSNGCDYLDQVEIRMTNLRLMSEAPGKVCACALAQSSTIYQNIVYIAFVDSATYNPYPGFAAFDANAASSTAWDNLASVGGGWDGYIANVVNSGLTANDPVDLIIRAAAPRGYPVDSACGNANFSSETRSSRIGTDEWKPDGDSLAKAHTGLRSFNTIGFSYTVTQSDSIEANDSMIIPNIPLSLPQLEMISDIEIYPVPASEVLTIQSGEHQFDRLYISDVSGRMVYRNSQLTEIDRVQIPIAGMKSGIYFLHVWTKSGIYGIKQLLIE